MTNTITHWVNNEAFEGSGSKQPVTNPATGRSPGRWRWPPWRMRAR